MSYLTPIQLANWFDLLAKDCESRPDLTSQGAMVGLQLAADLVRKRGQLVWSTNLPTEPGDYFVRRPEDHLTIVARIIEVEGKLMLELSNPIPVPPDHEWAGPIVQPIEPEAVKAEPAPIAAEPSPRGASFDEDLEPPEGFGAPEND